MLKKWPPRQKKAFLKSLGKDNENTIIMHIH